jgi:acyl-coenzyme A synthetase/AMP-(fatty) acid ligase
MTDVKQSLLRPRQRAAKASKAANTICRKLWPTMNIVEPILFQARCQPEAPALCVLGKQVISYSVLVNQMNNVARRALGHGLKRGNVVVVSTDQPVLEAVLVLGLTQIGIISISASTQAIVGLNVDALIGAAILSFPAKQHFPLDDNWIMGDGAPAEPIGVVRAERDDVCRMVLTSGSTGDPKAVALSHRQVTSRNARFQHLFGSRFPALSRVYMGLGLASSLGYYFLPYILGRGGTLFFRGTSLENALRMFEVFRVEAMLASPASLAQLLTACDQNPSSEIHFEMIVSSGGVLPRALVERARPRLCSLLVSAYGATETAISAAAPAHRIAHIDGAVGYVAPGVKMQIVDDKDRQLPANARGIVRIASEFAVDHYVGDEAKSAPAFRDGYFYPGDLGSLTPENLLVISGRSNNVLNVGGEKTTAEQIEATLSSYEGVRQVAVFIAVNKRGIQEVWAAVVCPENFDAVALQTYCRQRMPSHFVPKHVVNLDELPTSPMGNVMLPRLKAILRAKAQLDSEDLS